MKKIYLDAGHGGVDAGAIGFGMYEKDWVLSLNLAIKQVLLTQYEGAGVKCSRETDIFLELSKRAKLANDWGADVFVSSHLNASGGKGHGFETFVYTGASSASIALQNIVHQEAFNTVRAFGNVSDRGKKRANYAVLRLTKMPAILTETLFIDNQANSKILKQPNFLQAMAEAYARGIAQFLGLKAKGKVEVPKVSEAHKTESQPLEDLPKVTSLGDKYSFQVKAMQDTPVYEYANLSNRKNTLREGTVFSVYGYTYAAWAVGGGGFVMMKHVDPVPVTLTTGGLNKSMEDEFRAFLKKEGIAAELNLNKTGNPSASITVQGLDLVKVRQFLDQKGWYFK
ncbi:N-acetylmuramoyl-L-alanine amidase [Priestia flexa]|uniref:N-acetylmuramoyl-L-alanine amidase n=1 Tax=Priestia flexa TaxID=86664 RepID=UPI001F4D0371|nr:N-acetylmuramoyl-L-alanine amidase [Priestia flexa]